MKLSAPTYVVFLISAAIAVLVVAVKFAGVAIPVINDHAFEALLASYVVLVIGVLLPGI